MKNFLKKVTDTFTGGTGGSNADTGPATDPFSPIAGLDLEQYCDLVGQMQAPGLTDADFVSIAEANGVDAERWQEARDGWNTRLADPSHAKVLPARYLHAFQAAVARHAGPPATATVEQYIEMSAWLHTEVATTPRPTGLEVMCERFGITPLQWSQIGYQWTTPARTDPDLAKQISEGVQAESARLDAAFAAGEL